METCSVSNGRLPALENLINFHLYFRLHVRVIHHIKQCKTKSVAGCFCSGDEDINKDSNHLFLTKCCINSTSIISVKSIQIGVKKVSITAWLSRFSMLSNHLFNGTAKPMNMSV